MSNLCSPRRVWRPPKSALGGLRRTRQLLSFWNPRGFDILPDIPGVDFDAAWERRVEAVIDPTTGVTAFFVSKDDLIASKLASGRMRDLADVEEIRAAAQSQGQRVKSPEPAPNGPKQ